MIFWAYGVTLTKRIHANTYQINYVMGLIILFTGSVLYPYKISSTSTSASSSSSTTNYISYDKLFMAFLLTGIPITICQAFYIAALTMS